MILVLAGAILPFILWPVEIVLPFPYLVEEIAKAILVFFIVQTVPKLKDKIQITLLAGLLFSISESVMYLFNIYQIGSLETLLIRLILTIPLHIGTMLLILLFGLKRKEMALLGLLLAVPIHYFFNILVGRI
ncbi:MAG: PrsW family intramembrane metalloprotease [Candidatus Levybacteria bacterium]|nr:PrsW family intramembrane metalloprotease [Candidatus Levybacteria bacterium]